MPPVGHKEKRHVGLVGELEASAFDEADRLLDAVEASVALTASFVFSDRLYF